MYGYDEIAAMSLATIKKLNAAGIRCCILTKGILPIELAGFSKENDYGITLISLEEEYRERVEPSAAPYKLRMKALKDLHDKGCKTWVSMKPYPAPNLIVQNLGDILASIKFVDKIIFGRTNYNREVSAYIQHKAFYNECATQVMQFCKKEGISYHIKDRTITN